MSSSQFSVCYFYACYRLKALDPEQIIELQSDKNVITAYHNFHQCSFILVSIKQNYTSYTVIKGNSLSSLH